jgi:hypothetical protein
MEPRWNVTSSALDQTNQVRAGLADQAWAGTGAPGTRVADSTAAVDSVVQSLVLNSATEANGSVAWHGSRPAELVTDATKLAFITPANTVKDDAMIVQIAARGGAATSVTPPVGWLLVDARDNGLAIKSMIYERTATSNATETYTWTFGSAPQATGGIVSYGGASTESRASVDEVQVWDPDTAKFKPCPAGGAPDGGLQRVTLTVESNDGRFLENVDVVKRKP